jgi:uncharacterized protein DUF6983
VPLNINGVSFDIGLNLHYNEIAGYWVMTLTNAQGAILLDSIPLMTGSEPAGNILGQYAYLGLGGMTVINASQANDYPTNTQLGKDFFLISYDA